MNIVTEKRCSRCGELRDAGDFYKDKKYKDGLESSCKSCCRARAKQYAMQYPERVRERSRRYYWSHHEKCLSRNRAYSAAHPGRCAAYHAVNRETSRARLKEQRLSRRREAIMRYGGRCVFCGDKNINHLCLDHINGNGNKHRRSIKGTHIYRWVEVHNYPEGFQVLCHTHNCEKGYYGTMTPAEFDK